MEQTLNKIVSPTVDDNDFDGFQNIVEEAWFEWKMRIIVIGRIVVKFYSGDGGAARNELHSEQFLTFSFL